MRDAYREKSESEGPLTHSFLVNGMTHLLIDGLIHQFHDDPTLLLRTGPGGLAMGRIANGELISTDLLSQRAIDLANGTDELILDNVIEINSDTGAGRDLATSVVGVTRPARLVRLSGRVDIPFLRASIRPGTPGPITAIGCTHTGTGIISRPQVSSSSFLDGGERVRVTSETAYEASASLASGERLVFRGAFAGRGGFYFCARFATNSLGVENNAFVGLCNGLADLLPSSLPESLVNVVGMACESSSWSYWRIIWNDSSGIASWHDLGADFPFGAGVYELELWSEPHGAVINYRATRLDEAVAVPVVGVIDANMPGESTGLGIRAEINTGAADSSAAGLDVFGLYAESDCE